MVNNGGGKLRKIAHAKCVGNNVYSTIIYIFKISFRSFCPTSFTFSLAFSSVSLPCSLSVCMVAPFMRLTFFNPILNEIRCRIQANHKSLIYSIQYFIVQDIFEKSVFFSFVNVLKQ